MLDNPVLQTDTIVAPASGLGAASIGVIRISGSLVPMIAKSLIGQLPTPRYAHYCCFKSQQNPTMVLDKGLAIYFPCPHSFTGEDVLELQGHGSPVVIDQLIREIISLGARLAHPGEFSSRAFLNNKIDLIQAEAIADLINASSVQAARAAMQSLEGVFSDKIHQIHQQIITLRSYLEASVDFAEEEIDFLTQQRLLSDLTAITQSVKQMIHTANQGVMLQKGMTVVIVGAPNAGKSSLLNQLSQRDSAIVTEIPGTTRDLIRETIHLEGIPVTFVDTAGLRETQDIIEQAGIARTQTSMKQADHLLYLIDIATVKSDQYENQIIDFIQQHQAQNDCPVTVVFNKKDLINNNYQLNLKLIKNYIFLSAKTGEGIQDLKNHLTKMMGITAEMPETVFSARTRHIVALHQALAYLQQAFVQLSDFHSEECAAEELKLAHQALGEITGEFTSEDLLSRIFSDFCIGK